MNIFSAVHYLIGLNVHLLQIKTYCHKANHTTYCHIILLYLTVLISIYCRYKPTVTKLITLQIYHTVQCHTIFLHPTFYGTYQRHDQTLKLTWKGMDMILWISGLLHKSEPYDQLATYKFLHGVRHTNVSSQTKKKELHHAQSRSRSVGKYLFCQLGFKSATIMPDKKKIRNA